MKNSMKNNETLDFLKGTAMDGIINKHADLVEKVEAKVQVVPTPSVVLPVKKSSAKKTAVKQTAVKADNGISTTVRIKKSLLKQAILIFGEGKKTREITEHIFLEFIKKNKKVLVQNVEKEIENLRSTI